MSSLIPSLFPLLWVLLVAGSLVYAGFVVGEALMLRRWRRVAESLEAVLTELRELREAAKLRNASEAKPTRQAEKPMRWGMRPPNCTKPDEVAEALRACRSRPATSAEVADAFRREWDRYVAERRSADAAETASDKAIQAALAQGERDIAAGRGHDLDDVLAELDATADGDATVTVSKQPTDARPCRCGATKRCPTFYDRPVGIPMSAAPADVKPHPDEELASTVGGKPSESNPTDAALPEFRRLPLREGSPAFRELLRDWSARGGFFERMGPYQRPGRPVCVSIEYAKPAPPDGTLEIDSPDDEQPAYTLRLLPTGASYDDYVDRSTYRPCFGRAERRLVSWAEFDPNGLTAPPAQQAV